MTIITQIKTIQTRDCYYPIYQVTGMLPTLDLAPGYYFYDEEMESIAWDNRACYFGPYKDLDEVCKEQNKHWKSIQSL